MVGSAEPHITRLRRRLAVAGLVASLLALGGCHGAVLPSFDLKSLFTPNPAADTFPAWFDATAGTPESPGKPPAPMVAARPPTLARFKNMSAAGVVALVGEPDFRRVEPPAELWQYRGAACVVDFFLYRGEDGLRVIDADGRDRDPKHESPTRCRDGGTVLQTRLRTRGS